MVREVHINQSREMSLLSPAPIHKIISLCLWTSRKVAGLEFSTPMLKDPEGARPFTFSIPTARRHHFQLDQGVMPPRKDRLHTFVYLFSEEQRETITAWKCVWGLTSQLPWFPSFLILPCSLLPFIHQPDYILYLIAILWPFAFARSLVIGLLKSNSFLLATVTVAIVIGWDSSVGRESHPSFLAYRN